MKAKIVKLSGILLLIASVIVIKCSKKAGHEKSSAATSEVLSPDGKGAGGSALSADPIADFQNSSKYSTIASRIGGYGVVDFSEGKIAYYNDDPEKPWLSFAVKDRSGKVTGVLKSVRVAPAKQGTVGTSYISVFVHYADGFSETNPNGTVEIFDTDDLGQKIGAYTFVDGKASVDLMPPPEEEARTHYCDLNHNGNVTYGECFKCMIKACMSNTQCAAQCLVYNFIANYCNDAIGTSCVIISIIY